MSAKSILIVAAIAASALVAAALPATAAAPQAIEIDAYLYGQPDPVDPTNPNAFAISGCFAITGAIVDEGGAPVRDAAGDVVGCGSPSGIAGTARFDGLGHLKTGEPNVLQAWHTLYGAHGSISIKFEGKYEAIRPVDGRLVAVTGPGGGWQITGGTGAYDGLQGTGTATAIADFTAAFAGTGPVTVVHTETGDVHWR
jgi:hypothetical protein